MWFQRDQVLPLSVLNISGRTTLLAMRFIWVMYSPKCQGTSRQGWRVTQNERRCR